MVKPTKCQCEGRIESRLARIDRMMDNIIRLQVMALLSLQQLNIKENKIMADLSGIVAKVSEMTTVVDSAVALMDELKVALDAAKNDPVEIQAIIDSIEAEKAKLADAVVRNTEAEPVPEEPVV